MSNTVSITFVGNLADDPEMRFTPTGAAVAKFNVAVNERRLDKTSGEWKDAGVSWYNVTAWRQLAEHIAESLKKGTRVIVQGTLRQRTYEKDGETKYSWEVTADAVGPDLSYATATVKKMTRGAGRDDQWATDPATSAARPDREPVGAGVGGYANDEPPF